MLLEKVQCMFSNANLGTQFWVEALSHATFIVNRLPRSGVEYKTLMEVWLGSHASYDNVHIFGCLTYYNVRDEKIDLRAYKTLFKGSSQEVKGYNLWCLQDKKMVNC